MEQNTDDVEQAFTVLTRAAAFVPRDTATEAIQRARSELSPGAAAMRIVHDAFASALTQPVLGRGDGFHAAVIQTATRILREGSRPIAAATFEKYTKELAERSERLIRASEDERVEGDSGMVNESVGDAGTVDVKKYAVDEEFRLVATMGLRPTETGRDAACGYQLSRRTGKNGTMDLPEGTPVRYVGMKQVYPSQASSRRMMFRIASGTIYRLDGQELTLEGDIEVAGVVNHIDPSDPYNVQLRENEARKAERTAIRTAALARARTSRAA